LLDSLLQEKISEKNERCCVEEPETNNQLLEKSSLWLTVSGAVGIIKMSSAIIFTRGKFQQEFRRSEIVAKLGSEPEQFLATHFKTQVVAGTNYFVRIHIGQDKHIHVRIYKHFSGSVQLHGVKHHDVGGVGAGEALEYFDQNMN